MLKNFNFFDVDETLKDSRENTFSQQPLNENSSGQVDDKTDYFSPDTTPQNLSVTLLQQLSNGLSQELWKVYHKLVSKLRSETLTYQEFLKLLEISISIEKIDLERFVNLCRLSSLENFEIEEKMSEFSSTNRNLVEKNLSNETQNIIKEKAQGVCEYCRSQIVFSFLPFSFVLIIPGSKFGGLSLENLVFSCQGCEIRKSNSTTAIDPVTGEKTGLFNPRKSQWEEHFKWSDDFSFINGLTSLGRATISKLELNREVLILFRKTLRNLNKHPQFLS